MTDMLAATKPKSDQLNADDLIGQDKTIKITGVNIKSGEQPISVSYEGDGGKPYKPCKSMARVMVQAWGNDSKKYVGRSMTLFRDENVTWAGMKVGGIRISHMSHLEKPMSMALTMSKQKRAEYTVKPLETQAAPTQLSDDVWIALQNKINNAGDLEELSKVSETLSQFKPRMSPEQLKIATDLYKSMNAYLKKEGEKSAEQ